MATYLAIAQTFSYLTPDMWPHSDYGKTPYQEHTDYLAKNHGANTTTTVTPAPAAEGATSV